MKIKSKIINFFLCQKLFPFDTMVGFFFVYIGIFGLIYILLGKAVTSIIALGYKTTIAINAGYLVAGLAMFFGIGLNKYNIQAFGLVTVATSLAIRAILTGWVVGISNPLIINIIVLNGILILSCIVRLINIIELYKAKEIIVITK